MAMILSDGEYINNAPRFSFRLSPKVYQVPFGSRVATVRDESLRYRLCPLCSVVGLPSRAQHFSGARHDSLTANYVLSGPV